MKKSCKELKRLSRGILNKNWSLAVLASLIVNLIVSVVTSMFQSPIDAFSTLKTLELYPELIDIYTEYSYIPDMPSTTMLILSYIAILIVSFASYVFVAGKINFHLALLRDGKSNLKHIFTVFAQRPDRFIGAGILLALISLGCSIPMAFLTFLCAIICILLNTSEFILLLCTYLGMFVGLVAYIVLLFFFSARFSQALYFLADERETAVFESFGMSFRLMKGNCGRYIYMSLSFIPLYLVNLITWGIAGYWINPYIETVKAAFHMDVTGEFQRREEEARRLEEEMGPILAE